MRRDTSLSVWTHTVRIALLCSLWALAAGCVDLFPDDPDDPDGTGEIASAITLAEGFESGSKTAYAVADVTLGTGVWTLDEALIGTSTSDLKVGARSARVRTSGRITMKFDRTTGAGTVSVRHGTYGADASCTWALYSSTNGGGTWTQVGTSKTTTSSLATATFTVNVTGTIRFQIRKLDGTANRANIDDITVTDYGSGGGGGGGGSGAALSVHTKLGIPSPTSTSDPNSYLSVKSGYVISYNSSRKVPNWVSWELNTSYLGSTARQDDFRVDDTVSVPQASLADYSGSGYDRGHMCPSADRTLTVTANSQTFYLTNMIPQAGNNNRGPWASLEDYSRGLAETGKELFIVSGGTFSASSTSIGSGVKVPDKTFKVIVVLDAPGQGPGNVTTGTRVISVLMPNQDSQISLSAPWQNFRVSVDQIEALTGHDYLSDVDPAIQAVVEARVDNL
ncbi:MAG TPA: DNA/RNA non-specific endonuclease [Kofleriaceae bacterium]|nr:DNA/RNA non-specific endonuclease [Kofleriaceae bacterium]